MAKVLDSFLWPIIALAIIAVLVSKKSSTNTVIATMGTALSNILGAIVAPISNGTAASAASTATANTSTDTVTSATTSTGTNATK